MGTQNETRNMNGRSAFERRYYTVPVPPKYEGVGRALRDAYCLARSGMPADMAELLTKLDRL
jgi:hypothetical protein